MQTFPNLSQTYPKLSKPIQSSAELSKLIPTIFKPVQTYSNLYKTFQSYPNLFKPIQSHTNLNRPLQTFRHKITVIKDIKNQFIFQYYLHTLHYILTFLERPHLRTLAEQLAIFFYPVHPLYPQYGCCLNESQTINFCTMGLNWRVT